MLRRHGARLRRATRSSRRRSSTTARAASTVALFRRARRAGPARRHGPRGATAAPGMDAVAAVIVARRARVRRTRASRSRYLAHALLFVNNFYWTGNAEQRARYLPKVAHRRVDRRDGHDRAGASAPTCSACRPRAGATATRYVLNGRKTFITNGPEAPDVFLVYAKLEGAHHVVRRRARLRPASRRRRRSRQARHARVARWRARSSRTAACPPTNLLGDEGGGITHMMRNLEIERLDARRDEPRHRATAAST